MNIKKEVYLQCLQLGCEKVERLQNTLEGLRNSAANETKSTAGDKHETALAMLQIEQANTGRQLDEAQDLLRQLKALPVDTESDRVIAGSLVHTNQGFFFISVALGRIKVGDGTVFALSRNSPLGSKLFGLPMGGQAELAGKRYIIEQIL